MTADVGAGRSPHGTGAAARWALAALVVYAAVIVAPTSVAAQDSAALVRPGQRDGALSVVTTPLRVSDAGPGVSGRMLRTILAGPHVTLRGDSTSAVALRRDTTFGTSVVVLSGDVTVAGHVRGDLVAIGGDVFVRPGARIDGRAIAYGGAVYPSTLGIVADGVYSYRDHTFIPTESADGIALSYRDLERDPIRVVEFPFYGLQIPEYTRVDGLALGAGPTITVAEGGAVFVPTLTYRTHLGAVDPRVTADVRLDRRTRFLADVGRGTFSNDRWIRGRLLNSWTTLFSGTDTRNYFRADRADLQVTRVWEGASYTFTPFVGGRVERAWSTGPDLTTTTAPFTIIAHDDRDAILRPNPPVERGNIGSALAGGVLEWRSPQRLGVTVQVEVEQAFTGPSDAYDAFTQATGQVDIGFPTFGSQNFELTAHAVGTAGDAPPQRWAYLGGNGTLLTLDLLEMGGDELAYIESRYNIPIERVQIPFVGPPIFTLRHAMGSAGVDDLPAFVQNLGARLTIAVVRFDYTIDPKDRRSVFSVSFTVPF